MAIETELPISRSQEEILNNWCAITATTAMYPGEKEKISAGPTLSERSMKQTLSSAPSARGQWEPG
jgi:hypothetical protein